MKKLILILISLLILSGCASKAEKEINISKETDIHYIALNDNKATIDQKQINEYEYVWKIDKETGEEKYTGSIGDDSIYIAHDVIYYPEIDESEFVLENYDGEMEWVRYYQNDELKDYIFSTLPNLKSGFPSMMMHNAEDAYNNLVLHINEPGTYNISGSWHGQINIDLGDDAELDETKKVTLILDGVNVTCDVAPALIIKSAYEVDNTWAEKEEYDNNIDLSSSGATVIIKDGSVNNFTGSNVFRLLKPVYKKEGSLTQKKLYKIDGAFYSYVSLLIKGEEKGNGILNINSTTFEGLDSELHLQIDSGYINIVSYDDGINVNEDGVSVFLMNDGRLTIFAGQGKEGDVIDSNGFIKINGGTILGTSPSVSDNILDSDKGTEVDDSATIIASGALNLDYQTGFEKGGRMEFDKDRFAGPNEFGNPFDNEMREKPDFKN